MKEIFVHIEDMPKDCLDCSLRSISEYPNLCCYAAKSLIDDGLGQRSDQCPLKCIEDMPHYKSIQQWQKEVHENAINHGWWENSRTEGELLMLIVSEVAEAFEELRNGKGVNETYYSKGAKMEGVPSELADIVIRVMDFCEHYKIDLAAAIAEKHQYNICRPYKHGGKKL